MSRFRRALVRQERDEKFIEIHSYMSLTLNNYYPYTLFLFEKTRHIENREKYYLSFIE